jgi:hypothetical protein
MSSFALIGIVLAAISSAAGGFAAVVAVAARIHRLPAPTK